MLQVYRRVEKSLDNPYGVVLIKSISELDKPFLLCLSAQDRHDKSVFGIIKEGARAARVNTTDEIGAGFKIDEFPIAFLGVKFEKDSALLKNYEEIADSLLYPFLIGNETKTIEELKKRARKINLMTYCDGTLTYKMVEKRLEERLQNDGYSESDVKDILSQISLVAIGTSVDTFDMKATATTFIDVNDSEIHTGRTNGYKKLLQDNNRKSLSGTFGRDNNLLYVYDGSGNHFLKEYFLDENIVKPAISSVLAKYLQNSVENEHVENILAIDCSEVLKQLNVYSDETKVPVSLLRDLDCTLDYNGAPKYTSEEARIRHELDISYTEIQKTKMQLERAEREKTRKEQLLNSIVNGINQYSSETTFYQILVSAGMWQAPSGKDVFQEMSDKDIRKLYEGLGMNSKQEKDVESSPKL